MDIKSMNANVPEAISKIISAKGMKQYAVAQRAGMSAQMLTDIINGRRLIKAHDIIMLSKALEVTPNDLFTPTDRPA